MVQQDQCRIRSQRHVRIRTSKKTKEKKPSQRGLGIPELERMILKEQQKEIAAAALTPSILSPLPFPANLPLPTANFNLLTPISSVHLFGFHPFAMPPDPPYSQGGSSGRNWMEFVNYDGAEKGSQQKPPSMVNIPESPPFSSGDDLPMGLPSFQIYISKYLMRVRPEDDGLVITYKLREGPLSSSIAHAAANNLSFVKTIKENGSLDERIRTFGCPAASSKSKPKQPTLVPSTHRSEFIPSEGSMEQSILQWKVSPQPQPFYNFIPMGPSSDPSSPTSEGRVEKAGSAIDLNLKL